MWTLGIAESGLMEFTSRRRWRRWFHTTRPVGSCGLRGPCLTISATPWPNSFPLRNQSSETVGNRFAGIVDAQATLVADTRAVLYVWYDNEFGYSRQVVRCLEELAGVVMPNFPKRASVTTS